MKVWHTIYSNLITVENVFNSFWEFKKGKRRSEDIVDFERNLEDNLFSIYFELKQKIYRPGQYTCFYISDPKPRIIHKAPIRDRVVHHLVGNVLEKIFDPTYIAHSYSCRHRKGTIKGVLDLFKIARKVSKNNSRDCFALKCDIRKYFASINHKILFRILSKKIKDTDFLDLLKMIIDSFHSNEKGRGVPIGNLTSQHFANIYLNELDQFIKQELKVKYYLRYTDDFIILSADKEYLQSLLPVIESFLVTTLDIKLHPKKIKFLTYRRGFDFLGYVIFPHHIVPRTKTKKRVLRKIRIKIDAYKRGKISRESLHQTIQSYLGYLSHANTHTISLQIEDLLKDL